MEDPRKRASEGRKLFVDHSDVYFENERLAEELGADLDNLSRLRHRQCVSRDNEISKLRQTLTTMNAEKKASKSTSTTTTTTTTSTSTPLPRPHTSPAYRRVRPPTVMQVKVHVPSDKDHHNSHNHKHRSRNISDSSDDTSDDDSDSSDDNRRGRRRRNFGRIRSSEERLENGGGGREHGRSSPNMMVKKTTRQDMLLRQLGRKEVPKEWYTKVLAPSDTFVKRRAASARPQTTPLATPVTFPHPHSHPDLHPPSAGKNKKDGPAWRPARRAKSAMPFTGRPHNKDDDDSDDDEDDERCRSRLVCGGEPLNQKTGTMSRRQLRELSGGDRGSGADDVMRIIHRFREVERIKRENLQAKVQLFLRSCDQVAEGGVSSSRRSRDFQNLHVKYQDLYP